MILGRSIALKHLRGAHRAWLALGLDNETLLVFSCDFIELVVRVSKFQPLTDARPTVGALSMATVTLASKASTLGTCHP